MQTLQEKTLHLHYTPRETSRNGAHTHEASPKRLWAFARASLPVVLPPGCSASPGSSCFHGDSPAATPPGVTSLSSASLPLPLSAESAIVVQMEEGFTHLHCWMNLPLHLLLLHLLPLLPPPASANTVQLALIRCGDHVTHIGRLLLLFSLVLGLAATLFGRILFFLLFRATLSPEQLRRLVLRHHKAISVGRGMSSGQSSHAPPSHACACAQRTPA